MPRASGDLTGQMLKAQNRHSTNPRCVTTLRDRCPHRTFEELLPAHKMTQSELARKGGTSQAGVSEIVPGSSTITLDTLESIARGFGVEAALFISEDRVPDKMGSIDRQFFDEHLALPLKQRQLVRNLISAVAEHT